MYSAVLLLHSWIRWAVLLLAVLVILRAWTGLSARKLWSAADDRAMLFFTIALDIQTLFGLLLYVGVSPIIGAAFRNMSAAMANSAVRFFVVEHAIGMLVAVTLAHIGRAKVRKTADAHARYRTALTFTVLALIALLVFIPWPGLPAGRPLFRLSAR